MRYQSAYLIAKYVALGQANLLLGSRRLAKKIASQTSRDLLADLNVSCEVTGLENLPKGHSLIVANHVSYLDILILSALEPAIFVTSTELEEEALTGKIAKYAGSVFVERRSFKRLLKDIGQIKSLLRAKHTVCLFPEATTSAGTLLPFRSSLFEAAARTSTPVVPVAIEYLSVDGQVLAHHNKDLVYYYGEHDFKSHLLKLAKTSGISVRVSILKPLISPSRKTSCRYAYEEIKKALLD